MTVLHGFAKSGLVIHLPLFYVKCSCSFVRFNWFFAVIQYHKSTAAVASTASKRLLRSFVSSRYSSSALLMWRIKDITVGPGFSSFLQMYWIFLVTDPILTRHQPTSRYDRGGTKSMFPSQSFSYFSHVFFLV